MIADDMLEVVDTFSHTLYGLSEFGAPTMS